MTQSGETETELIADRAEADGDPQNLLGQTLTELFEIHRAMIGKLVLHDPDLANHVAEFLEDVANRYLDLSEILQSRKSNTAHRLNSIA